MVTKQVGAVQISAAVQDTSAEAAILVDDRAATIAGGKGFVCALDQTGAAYCWGGGFHGQLGDGSTATSPTPVRVSGDLRFHQIKIPEDWSPSTRSWRNPRIFCQSLAWGAPTGEEGNIWFHYSKLKLAVRTWVTPHQYLR